MLPSWRRRRRSRRWRQPETCIFDTPNKLHLYHAAYYKFGRRRFVFVFYIFFNRFLMRLSLVLSISLTLSVILSRFESNRSLPFSVSFRFVWRLKMERSAAPGGPLNLSLEIPNSILIWYFSLENDLTTIVSHRDIKVSFFFSFVSFVCSVRWFLTEIRQFVSAQAFMQCNNYKCFVIRLCENVYSLRVWCAELPLCACVGSMASFIAYFIRKLFNYLFLIILVSVSFFFSLRTHQTKRTIVN